jgi:hypothetical protein
MEPATSVGLGAYFCAKVGIFSELGGGFAVNLNEDDYFFFALGWA